MTDPSPSPSPDAKPPAKPAARARATGTGPLFRRLAGYLLPYRGIFVAGTLCSLSPARPTARSRCC